MPSNQPNAADRLGYVADVETAEYQEYVAAHNTYWDAVRLAPHMPGTEQARVTMEVAFTRAVNAAASYADTSLISSGVEPFPLPRVFHTDGCTGLVVDQYGNTP